MTTTVPRYTLSLPLQTEFVANCNAVGDNIFTQVKRQGNVCVYKRVRMDGSLVSFEVFEVKTVKAGSPLPNGTTVAADYEQYPGSSVFGKTAWAPGTYERAMAKFNELVGNRTAKNDAAPEPSTPQEVAPATVVTTSINIPGGEFSRKSFAEANGISEENPAKAYLLIKGLISEGMVKESRRVATGGRGRPMVLYVKA